MKKFFALIIFLLIISAQASAIRLELYPQPIGKIIFRYTLQNHFVDVVCQWHAANQKFYNEVIEQ